MPAASKVIKSDAERNDKPKDKKRVFSVIENNDNLCLCCQKSGHQLKSCKEFQKLPQKSRWDLVAANKLCFCCLQKGHRSNNCTDSKPCGLDG
ncbi:unnamed protein product, partial [Allacma fusca]